MGLLENLWDDVVAGPQPDARGRGHLRRISTGLNIKEGAKAAGSVSLPGSPTTPVTPGSAGKKVDVWRSVFHPASNLTTRDIGANVFDKPSPNSPTVYDWMYSGDSKSEYR